MKSIWNKLYLCSFLLLCYKSLFATINVQVEWFAVVPPTAEVGLISSSYSRTGSSMAMCENLNQFWNKF